MANRSMSSFFYFEAGVLTLSLYDIDVMIPFLIIGGLCFMSLGLAWQMLGQHRCVMLRG
jgi:hypothetical protein